MRLLVISEGDNGIVDKIRNAISGVEYVDKTSELIRLRGWAGAKRAGVKLWWHLWKKKAFISVGDWADSKPWVTALGKVVGKGNVDCGDEAGGPPGDSKGWIEVKEGNGSKTYSEGVVAAARGDIVNIVNDLAGKIASVAEAVFMHEQAMAQRFGIQKPTVEFSSSEDDPAIITIRIGRKVPQTISVVVYGDGGGEIRFEMTEQLSKLLNQPRTATLSSEDEVNQRLGSVVAKIKQEWRNMA